MENELLREIEAFLSRSGMSATYFGKVACNNSQLVERLKLGRTVTLATVARVRDFMSARENVEAAE